MTEWVLVPVEPTQAMIDATNSVPEGAGYLSCVRAYRAMLDAAPAWQAEPVAWVRNLTDPQPHCVTGLQYRTAADADAGVQYIPVYLHPPADEVQQAEPVAWMKPTRDSCYLRSAETMLAIHEDCDGIVRTGWKPLYLHPPADEVQRLRDAAGGVLAIVESIGRRAFTLDGWMTVQELRRALEGCE